MPIITPVLVVSPDGCLDMYTLHLMAIGALRRAGHHTLAEELHHRAEGVTSWELMVKLVEEFVDLRWP